TIPSVMSSRIFHNYSTLWCGCKGGLWPFPPGDAKGPRWAEAHRGPPHSPVLELPRALDFAVPFPAGSDAAANLTVRLGGDVGRDSGWNPLCLGGQQGKGTHDQSPDKESHRR